MPELLTRKSLERYQIVKPLGGGGMGLVYQGYDPNLKRTVAIKVMHSHMAHQPQMQERFLQEARAAAQLDHPGIVRVFDFGHDPPYLYIVMEFIRGDNLQQMLTCLQKDDRWLPLSEALRLGRCLCLALHEAHRAGVLHRDIKPANIMLKEKPGDDLPYQPVITDLGLAKLLETGLETQPGIAMGTPAYMSPEQVLGRPVDGRSDVYSLGVLLYELVSGRLPFPSQSLSPTELMAHHVRQPPPSPRDHQPDLPPAVERLILTALEKEPDNRFPDAAAMAVAIRDALADLSASAAEAGPTAAKRTISLSEFIDQAEATPPPPDETDLPDPFIDNPRQIDLPAEAEAVLKRMFAGYERVVIRKEFGSGQSGGRVLEVRPVIAAGEVELRAVVKLGAISLIQKEFNAYTKFIVNKLPYIANIIDNPVLLPEQGWGGLRYTLQGGGGTFEVVSLLDYSRRAEVSVEQAVKILNDLLKIMDNLWSQSRLEPDFYLQRRYARLLPVDWLLRHPPAQPDPAAPLMTPERLPSDPFQAGQQVRVQGFAVVKVDWPDRSVTLQTPEKSSAPTAYVRLKSTAIEQFAALDVGQIIAEPLPGQIIETRDDRLRSEVQAILGPTVEPTAPLPLPDGTSLTNPLTRLEDLLDTLRPVKFGPIHGDFNLENILIDERGFTSLIDFAEARRDHLLHDPLRLETEITTKLLADRLDLTDPATRARLVRFYHHLHQVAFAGADLDATLADPDLAGLEKPFVMLATLRRLARPYLAAYEQPAEYYQGLGLYLLGAIKFGKLPPAGKQAAFWGAAVVGTLVEEEPQVSHQADNKPSPNGTPAPPAPRLKRWLWPVAAVLLLLLAVGGWLYFEGNSGATPSTGEKIATIIGLNPEVKVERSGSDHNIPADFGMDLFRQDVIQTRTDARADIACNNGLIFTLEAGRNIEVTCESLPADGVVIVREVDETIASLVEVSDSITDSISPSDVRGSREEQADLPLLLTPRNTVITGTQPTFAWQPVAGAEGYRLTVNLADGQTWEREIGAARIPYLSYPAEAPPLEPGSVNTIRLTTLAADSPVDRSVLRVADEPTRQQVASAAADIRALGLDPTAEGFLLAQLYRQNDLTAAAIAQLEALAAQQPAPSAALHQQLGDLHLDAGLPGPAEALYETALTAAQDGNDLTAQAAALLGLTRTAAAFDEIEAAVGHLAEAETLYRELGQTDLADAVAEERAGLE